MKKGISIIGTGRVGRALGRALRQRGWKIGAVVTRSTTTARAATKQIGAGRACATFSPEIFNSSVVLITVPDREVAKVGAALCRPGFAAFQGTTRNGHKASILLPIRGKIVLHTSGSLSHHVLRDLEMAGASCAAMHPMQTFRNQGTPDLRGVVFGIDGHPRAVRVAKQIARDLGGVPVEIAAENKPAYHCSGAFAAPHVLTMMEAGATMLMRIGFSRRQASRALLNLARQTLHNFETVGGRGSYTGPLSRGDYATVARHVQMLKKMFPELVAAYVASTHLGVRLLSKNPKHILKMLSKG